MKYHNNINCIYGYFSNIHNRIMYVGQTRHLNDRNRAHLFTEPYRTDQNHYKYPLSRGIRKYGINNYELQILEEYIPEKEMDNRERYWIKYYDTYKNGYNQTEGGGVFIELIYDEKIIRKIIDLLQHSDLNMAHISEYTGVSMTHVWNINMGYRRKQEDIEYPIRSNKTKGVKGLTLSEEENLEIHYLLKYTNMSYKEIMEKFNVSQSTLTDINLGYVNAYKIEGEEYPLRYQYSSLSQKEVLKIIELIKQGETFTEIGKMYNVESPTIAGINYGTIEMYRQQNINYPIKDLKTDKQQRAKIAEKIQNDLLNTNLSFEEIFNKYPIKRNFISRVNTGRSFKNPSLSYPLRKTNRINNLPNNPVQTISIKGE